MQGVVIGYTILWLAFFPDSRPKFISPSADGTHNLIVDETADTGVDIITLEAKDPENDNVTFSVVGDYTDMFNITGNSLYNIRPLDYETRCSFDVTIRLVQGSNDTTRFPHDFIVCSPVLAGKLR